MSAHKIRPHGPDARTQDLRPTLERGYLARIVDHALAVCRPTRPPAPEGLAAPRPVEIGPAFVAGRLARDHVTGLRGTVASLTSDLLDAYVETHGGGEWYISIDRLRTLTPASPNGYTLSPNDRRYS